MWPVSSDSVFTLPLKRIAFLRIFFCRQDCIEIWKSQMTHPSNNVSLMLLFPQLATDVTRLSNVICLPSHRRNWAELPRKAPERALAPGVTVCSSFLPYIDVRHILTSLNKVSDVLSQSGLCGPEVLSLLSEVASHINPPALHSPHRAFLSLFYGHPGFPTASDTCPLTFGSFSFHKLAYLF